MYLYTKKIIWILVLITIIFKSELTFSNEENLSIRILSSGAIRKTIGNFPTKGLADSQNKATITTIFASNNGPLTIE